MNQIHGGEILNTKFTLGDSLVGAVKLTQNADTYRCSCYGTGFDARLQFSLSIDTWGKNVVIFGRNNSSSWHTDNRKKKS